MTQASVPRLSAEVLSAATGEPIERLGRLRSLGLIGLEADGSFGRDDIERVHLIHFLERRQVPLEVIACAEREEEILTSVLQFLFPQGVGPTYSLGQAVEIAGVDI